MKGAMHAHFDYWWNRDGRKALTKSLLAEGHQVWVFTCDPQAARQPEGARVVGWDGRNSLGWGGMVSQIDAVVNLVGEYLSSWPWTK